MSSVLMVIDGKCVGLVLLGGPVLEITVRSKVITFEDSQRFGPALVNELTHELLDRWPSRDFYLVHERWVKGGRQVSGTRCIVPDLCMTCRGDGVVCKRTGWRMRRSGEVTTCTNCNGTGIEQAAIAAAGGG